MKLTPFVIYTVAKVKQDEINKQKDNYINDCLWALATERRFTNKDKESTPSMPRWADLINPKPKKEDIKTKITKEDIKDYYRKNQRKKKNKAKSD